MRTLTVAFGSHRVEALLPLERRNGVRRAPGSRALLTTEMGWPPGGVSPRASGKAGANVSSVTRCLRRGAVEGPTGDDGPRGRLGGRFAGCPPETPGSRCRLWKEFEAVRGGIVECFRKQCRSRTHGVVDPHSGADRYPRVSARCKLGQSFSETARSFGRRQGPGNPVTRPARSPSGGWVEKPPPGGETAMSSSGGIAGIGS